MIYHLGTGFAICRCPKQNRGRTAKEVLTLEGSAPQIVEHLAPHTIQRLPSYSRYEILPQSVRKVSLSSLLIL